MKNIFFMFLLFIYSCTSKNEQKVQNDLNYKSINSNEKNKIQSIKTVEKQLDTPFRVQDLREENIDVYKKNIRKNGDLYSFNVLAITYQNMGDYESILPYAFLMAEKYDKSDAYETFFTNSIQILHNGKYKDEYFFELDSETQRFLKHYLKKGAELGQSKCIRILANLEIMAKERKIEF